MSRAPLFRTRLLRLGADDHVLLLILHHIIVDGWSIGVFMEEVSELYAAFAAGRQAQLPEPALQFSDFARWQRRWSTSDAATQQFAYWKQHLRGASPVFPTMANIESALLCSRIAHEPVRMSNDSGRAPERVEPSPRGNAVHDVAGGLQDAADGPERTQ